MSRLYQPSIELEQRLNNVFKIFDNSIDQSSNVIIAYSGGKDSTTLAILFYYWLRTRAIIPKSITLLYNDTLSEIDTMESWTLRFMQRYRELLERLNITTNIKVMTPPIIDTFYWRVFVRGYPAPTFNFRWCVNLLKMRPANEVMKLLQDEGSIILVGLRDSESITRKSNMNKRYGNTTTCMATASKCLAYYYSQIDDANKKVAPLRDWRTVDIWEFLRSIDRDEFNLDDLFTLYNCDETRYGCWHCTLVKTQWGLHAQNNNLLYLEAVRILYRAISDIPELRLRKSNGYSRLGALNGLARCILLNSLKTAEELSGMRLYALDMRTDACPYSLRDILFNIDAKEAMDIIFSIDKRVNKNRVIPIDKIRSLRSYDNGHVSKILEYIVNIAGNHTSMLLANKRGFNPLKEIITTLRFHIDSK